MRKLFFALAFLVSSAASATEVGFGIDTGRSTVPRKAMEAFIDTNNIPPGHGEFVDMSAIVFDKRHCASWILSLGMAHFEWGNPERLKGTPLDLSGTGSLTSLSLEKQIEVYARPRFDLHFRSGVGMGRLTTTLDGGGLAVILRNQTQRGYVPLMHASGGVAFHPTPSVAFGIDTGWGYLWEEYRLSVMCRF